MLGRTLGNLQEELMSYRNLRGFTVLNCALLVAVSFGLYLFTVGSSRAQDASPPQRGKLSTVPAKALDWPLPAGLDKSYAAVDGHRLHVYLDELAAISEKYRAAGNQWWGRIPGMSSGLEAQDWAKAKFKAIGVPTEVVNIPDPQDLPKSWDLSVSANGKTLHMDSSDPTIDFPRFAPAMKGDQTMDTVWVGLGQPADYIGKDVKGKAVFIYSIPTPSDLVQSAMWMESVGRAQKAGAAAIIVDIAIPGNMHYVSHMEGGRVPTIKIPIFTVGDKDGHSVEELIAANNGAAVKTHLTWENAHYPDLKEDIVIGKLEGMTDEKIVMIAHVDGYFDAAIDDGAGTAALLGTAEYFAKMPKEKRRRTMYFISLPDHHGGDYGGDWLHKNLAKLFPNTVVLTNAEHVAVTNPVWDRPWFTNDQPTLVPTNASGPSWWGVYGSDKLAHIVVDDYATFGVPTQIAGAGSAGQLARLQFDAPSFYLHNKGVYYHCDGDTVDKVPESTLKNTVQAFAKIFNDINKLDAKDLLPPPSSRPGAAVTSLSKPATTDQE
jgi:hypothetical protein